MTTLDDRTTTFDEAAAPNFARPMPNWQPLVEYRRNGVAENTIHGAVSWVSGRNLLYSFGGNVEVYGRSMVKPIMMKVFRKEFATALTSEQRAISCASHNGDTEHVAVARSILLEGEWGLMQTPLDVPLIQFGRQVRRPRRWYHCCSGEHAASGTSGRITRFFRSTCTTSGECSPPIGPTARSPKMVAVSRPCR
jgi:L-asparaginase II